MVSIVLCDTFCFFLWGMFAVFLSKLIIVQDGDTRKEKKVGILMNYGMENRYETSA